MYKKPPTIGKYLPKELKNYGVEHNLKRNIV